MLSPSSPANRNNILLPSGGIKYRMMEIVDAITATLIKSLIKSVLFLAMNNVVNAITDANGTIVIENVAVKIIGSA
ncbi:hypothetical protein PC1C4_16530 [Paraprevotella clara]|nr:hypothetical protein PC1C4_16530 [Paraprevotella clara]